MWLKYPFIILFLLFLALLQNSFLPRFSLIVVIPNLVFILFFILTFFSCIDGSKKPLSNYKIILIAIVSGFILDAFSSFWFGLSIISFLLSYILIETMIHFLKERQDKYLLLYFIPMFLIVFSFYNIFVFLLTNFPNFKLDFNQNIFVGLFYNLILAFIGFFVYININNNKEDRQLKLFT